VAVHAQIGWALAKETTEVVAPSDVDDGRHLARYLAPRASAYIHTILQQLKESGVIPSPSPAHMEAIDLDTVDTMSGNWRKN
jgi:hypothetical protein